MENNNKDKNNVLKYFRRHYKMFTVKTNNTRKITHGNKIKTSVLLNNPRRLYRSYFVLNFNKIKFLVTRFVIARYKTYMKVTRV